MNKKDEKRKRSPILATVRRATKLIIKSGNAKNLIITSIWMLLGAVTSFTAVFNEQFLNATAKVIDGDMSFAGTAIRWLIIWGIVEIAISLVTLVNNRISVEMREELSYYVSDQTMSKICKIRLKYFDDREAQKKIRFAKNGLGQRISQVTNSTLRMIRSMITLISAFLILLRASWVIAIIVFVAVLPAVILGHIKTEKYYELNQWQSFEGQMQRYLALLLIKRKYIKEMRFYQLYDYIQEKYDDSVEVLNKQQMKLAKTFLYSGIGTSVLTYGSIAISLAIISSQIFSGAAEIGAFMLVYNTVRNMQNNLLSIFDCLNVIGDQGRYLEDYETVMAYEEEPPVDLADVKETNSLEIKFENVSFTYPNTDREVLSDINLTIRQGEKLAIVGENGSGKSTFVALMTGLYEPTKGRILVNGVDISNNLGLLRSKLSCTMQDYLHHHDTVAENIRIGDTLNEHSDEDVRLALKKAGISDYVEGLESGTETYLGNLYPNSTDLSGGQWQKLAMARNLIKQDACIMVMDEPTAALDPLAESKLYEEFSNLTGDKTVILISHRLGATRLADRVMVFDDGRIVEDGTHEQLLKNNQLYTAMYRAQAQWYTEG